MNPFLPELNRQSLPGVTRRQFFGRAATGLGSLALASLLREHHEAAASARKHD